MKRLLLLVFLAAGAFAQLAGVHTVYILPMAGGLTNTSREWLTRDHVMQVVADPKAADAVLTDRLGKPSSRRWPQIHPPGKDDQAKADKTDGAGTTHNSFRPARPAEQFFWSMQKRAPFSGRITRIRRVRRPTGI